MRNWGYEDPGGLCPAAIKTVICSPAMRGCYVTIHRSHGWYYKPVGEKPAKILKMMSLMEQTLC